ncbi:multicopper oxidase [Acrodontium crateriforme]|uniref:laccase n=1 Tax=Acrodontium crateriforme TaxID=150365 RepID=A0AAQ3M4V7_9PEZI|nr:multicopper oxidase [Acrodontium crateriforme]
MPNNGTSIHWHGMRQLNRDTHDGVPGITECLITPGGSKTYTFQATQHGTSWYHSHFSSQYGDGIVGPIVIHGPATANYDYDLGPLPITDWYYPAVAVLASLALHTNGLPPEADNALINGSMTSSSGAILFLSFLAASHESSQVSGVMYLLMPANRLEAIGSVLKSKIKLAVVRTSTVETSNRYFPTRAMKQRFLLANQLHSPTSEYVKSNNTNYPTRANVIELPQEGQWTYWVIQGIAGSPYDVEVPHPIHLHGHDFYILGTGQGQYTNANSGALNYINPTRRDTAILPGGEWLALVFQTDNPGAWVMHCHIAWHADEGFAVHFLETVSIMQNEDSIGSDFNAQ